MMRAKLVAAGEAGMFFMSAVSKSEVSGDIPLSTLM